MNVTGVKAHISAAGGKVTDTGYVQSGRTTVAHVEAYFEGDVPELGNVEFCDRTNVDYDWDRDNGGILVEVDL